ADWILRLCTWRAANVRNAHSFTKDLSYCTRDQNPGLNMNAPSLFSLVLVSLCGVTAYGTVINADGNAFTSPAPPWAILDTATQILWLDATETKGRSLPDVTSKLGVGQEFDGWQLASIAQVDELFANAGLSDTNSGFVSNASAKADVISFVGIYG